MKRINRGIRSRKLRDEKKKGLCPWESAATGYGGSERPYRAPRAQKEGLKSSQKNQRFAQRSGRTGRRVFPDNRINGEPLHEPAELLRSELSGFRRIAWPGEMPVFHALCEEKKSIPLPEEPFDLAGTPATEEEQGVRNKVEHSEPFFSYQVSDLKSI